MRLLTMAEIDQMRPVPGTCEWCGQETQVYALALWACRPCLAEDMRRNGEATGPADRGPGEGHDHPRAEGHEAAVTGCPPAAARQGEMN
jgi:hypothetical protein